jgi:trehalose 6-phosphate synthase
VASTRVVLGRESEPRTFASSLGVDDHALREFAESEAVRAAGEDLEALVGDCRLIVRSDRIDPSKNIARGFIAFDELLDVHPEWRERTIFVAMLNASRQQVPDYLAYRQEVEQAGERVNERWGTRTWQPVVIDTRDDYARNVAGLARYDVLFVNPLKDGLNLVAKEGPIVNGRDGVVCLSPEAGSYEELQEAVLPVHPYDVSQAAEVLHDALSMPMAARADRAARLRALARARSPRDWLDDQLIQTSG